VVRLTDARLATVTTNPASLIGYFVAWADEL
jgi:hypothetical protein